LLYLASFDGIITAFQQEGFVSFRALIRSILFCAALVIACSSILVNQRMDRPGLVKQSIAEYFQSELRFFASSVLWKKLDTYGHYGKWKEKKSGDQILYYSSFRQQDEFMPLLKTTVKMDPELISRSALYASELYAQGKESEAIYFFRSLRMRFPENERLYRIYGELGLIATREHRTRQALRYYERAFEVLPLLKEESRDWEDNIYVRMYAGMASQEAYQLGFYEKAFEYFVLSDYQPGSESYMAKMHSMMADSAKQWQVQKQEPVSHHKEEHEHHHDEEIEVPEKPHMESHHHHHEHEEVSPQDVKKHYYYFFPRINTHLFYPINWTYTWLLWGISILLGFIIFAGEKYSRN
jgi:hypothetical protein